MLFLKEKMKKMSVVFDEHEEKMKKMHDFLTENKMTFTQFIRAINFRADISREEFTEFLNAYKNGEFNNHGWY